MSTADLLAQGIAVARAGRKDEAQAIFLKVLEADDRNEMAWLWLSGVIEPPDERRVCLENVLAINPANAHARRGLELLVQSARAVVAAPPASPPAAPPPSAVPPPAPPPSPAPQAVATMRLPAATDTAPTAEVAQAPVGPSTGNTIELPAEAVQAPPKQPWWSRQKPKVAAPPTGMPPSAAPPPGTPQVAAPPPPSAVAARPSLELPRFVAEDSEAEEPCPYCGATTLIGHRSCPACRKSLMMRGQPRAKRSVALMILVVIYALNSLGTLVGGVMLIIAVVGLASAFAEASGRDFPYPPVVGLVLAVLILVGSFIAITLGLYRRKPGAYIAHCVNAGFSALSIIGLIALSTAAGAALLRTFSQLEPQRAGEAAGAVGSLGMAIVGNVIVFAGFLALTVLSHHDFYGRKARMSTAGLTSTGDPYNAGISYRNRGMWYMAAHEWELAVIAAPGDVRVRRALGLAYAQIKRYEAARDALGAALAMAPGDPQLTEDLTIVERLAAKR